MKGLLSRFRRRKSLPSPQSAPYRGTASPPLPPVEMIDLASLLRRVGMLGTDFQAAMRELLPLTPPEEREDFLRRSVEREEKR